MPCSADGAARIRKSSKASFAIRCRRENDDSERRMKLTSIRHVRGFDVARPISIGMMLGIMLPLVLLPLLSIFIYGTNKGLGTFWSALVAPEAIFALKLSMVTSFWATVFNVIFGLFAAYVLSRYDLSANCDTYGRRWFCVAAALGSERHAGTLAEFAGCAINVHALRDHPRQ